MELIDCRLRVGDVINHSRGTRKSLDRRHQYSCGGRELIISLEKYIPLLITAVNFIYSFQNLFGANKENHTLLKENEFTQRCVYKSCIR